MARVEDEDTAGGGAGDADARPSLEDKLKSNRKKQSQSQEFSLGPRRGSKSPIKLRVRALDTEDEMVIQRDSNVSANDRAFNLGAALEGAENEEAKQPQDIIVEQYDHTDEDESNEGEPKYMPIVIVPSEKMRSAIEHISLELARTYREKIMSKVPDLCQLCNIEGADQVFD